MFEVLLPLAGIVLTLIAMVFKARNKELAKAWDGVATKFNLSHDPARLGRSPRLDGVVNGYPVSVDIKKRGGKNRPAYTRFVVAIPSLGLGLKLKQEGFLDGITKAFGAQDIQTGDDAFDSQIVIKGSDGDSVRAFLTSERRMALQRFMTACSGAVVTDQEISWLNRGVMRNKSDIAGAIENLVQVAEVLAGTKQTDTADALTADIVEPEPEPGPEAEPAVAEFSPNKAKAPAPDLSSGSLSAAAFCDAVFAEGSLSFEAMRNFEAEYADERVTWSGELKAAEPYKFDFVFGNDPGVRATLKIKEGSGSGFLARDVNAVVALPATTGNLESKLGQQVTFTGTLRKVDGLAKKVFLADAKLAG